MRHTLRKIFLVASILATTLSHAAIREAQGWFESCYATWDGVADARTYNVYIEGGGMARTLLDKELVRQYPGYYRADAVGLKAGQYTMTVIPVDASGSEMAAQAMTTAQLTVSPHDRSGFAHVGMTGGIGAYKNDGTLKDGAKVIYVWADNAKTVTTDVVTNSKGTKTTGTGLQNIIYLYQKGYDTTPLDIRIIGTVKKEDCDALISSAEGLQIKGSSDYMDLPLTIEGIGNDATISGFGMLLRNVKDVELRNFAIILCLDDCLSLDTKNSNIWIHNIDFFYGNTGGDADQAKGDGTVDIKAASKNVTLSYCHFYDCGKSSLGGMSNEVTSAWHTYHHNWFDHSDSRHPRVRVQFFHVYNNYFDGVSKYGIGMTSGGSAFVENNYFRNCKYPMLISKQGTDAEGDGTFSGEPGGVIKAYNNTIRGARKLQYYDGSQTDGRWDAVLVTSRDEAVTAKCLSGGTGYNAAADEALRTTYIENHMDNPDDVPAIVKGWLGAGRMGHGDIKWTFNNSVQDENYGVITELKAALTAYKSTLIGFADGTAVSNGGATETVDGGDGKGIDPELNDSYVPTYGGGGGTITSGEYVIGTSAEYFWTTGDNATETEALIANGTITMDEASHFRADKTIVKGDGTVISDKVGALDIVKNTGYATFYLADGIQTISFYLARTGSMAGKVMGSDDGTTFSEIQSYSAKSGIYELTVTPSAPQKYIRLTNTATGSLNIQGIKIAKPGEGGSDPGEGGDPVGDEKSNDATATFTINGTEILTTGTYTMSVPYDATETLYTITVAPADLASVKTVSGATANGANTYTIPAPQPGETVTATFTIVAENGTTTKTYTINITKGVDPATLPEKDICHFILETKSPSKSYVSVTGNYSNSKGSVTYDGETYTDCVKMESATQITITPPYDCTVTLVFGEAGKRIKLNGEAQVTGADGRHSFAANASQQYLLTKGDVANLFLVILEKQTSTGISLLQPSATKGQAQYTIDGRRITSPRAGTVYISGGKKRIARR